MLSLKTRNKIDTEFEMSSMTDIVFLLLIFFMLSYAYGNSSSIQVSLPISNSTDTSNNFLSVVIDKNLDYYVSDNKVDINELNDILSKKINDVCKNILVEADENVPITYVVKVADIAISLNANLAIATRPLN